MKAKKFIKYLVTLQSTVDKKKVFDYLNNNADNIRRQFAIK